MSSSPSNNSSRRSSTHGGPGAAAQGEAAVEAVAGSKEATEASVALDAAPLTPEERSSWATLQSENQQLIKKLAEINAMLDAQLAKEGIGAGGRSSGGPPAAAALNASESDRLLSRVLALRKENGELSKGLKERQSHVGATFDMRNRLNQLTATLEQVRGENQSLENVYKNQQLSTTKVDKEDSILSEMKSAHNDECREQREKIRQVKELRESDMMSLRSLLRQEDFLREKQKFLDAVREGSFPLPADYDTAHKYDIAELQTRLAALVAEEEAVKAEAEVVVMAHATERHNTRRDMDKKHHELEELKSEYLLLKEHLEALS